MSDTYGLGFIRDEQLFEHVKDTVQKYRFKINLSQFNKNLLDPIKLTFDSKVYGKTVPEIIESESIRQIDKSNTNHIGYFHQNIFNFIDGWEVPEQGFDAINSELNIYVEMKNKHNTMNSASSQKTYMKMQNKIVRDDKATCYLVEVIAKNSQDIPWTISLDSEKISHKNIRRASMDKFYEIATGDAHAFKKLCQILPKVIDDVIAEANLGKIENTVLSELEEISDDVLKSIYLLPFQQYEGFDELNFD
ncbi:Eco47II family restriction endonuclease [Vibrio gallicus]|uniref:Eco47II family restriction endonuclease n=1 Tax=Vibrio gallicus TaxID=190897 RepID=UPI0021C2EF16|nr:Eco47II family restriction endonuclease [Vibrio gallicus]